MKKIFFRLPRMLIAAVIVSALVFASLSLGMLDPMLRGIDIGEIGELNDGWRYTVDGGDEVRETSLPTTLNLPEDAKQITLTTTLPGTVKGGDVLRFHTLLGWYRIYVDGELRLKYGTEEITERYLLENGSNRLLIALKDEDAGRTLRVETGFLYANYLAQQHAPTLSSHRDLLMSDIIGSSSSMILTMFIILFSIILLVLWLLFLIRRQPRHLLAGCATFLLMGVAYYNVGNTFQCELWGYPDNLPMYNDFIYYVMEFLIPVAGYQLVLSAAKERPSRALGAFLLAHTLYACGVIVVQMFWSCDLAIPEYISAIATVAGYTWLWLALRPIKLDSAAREICIPVFVCILAYLLDYYKLTGLWWPLPQNWITYLQVELPFMAFFPVAMLLFMVMTILALVQILTNERVALMTQVNAAQFQAELAEREYYATMENLSQIRQVRHDLNHHLTVLGALAEQGDQESLLAYLKEISDTVPDQTLSGHNLIAASFIEYYRPLCHDAGIRFEDRISYDESCLTKKTHLGILLGNALKNAYEAARAADGPDRFITVDGRQQGQQLILVVKNAYSGVLSEPYLSTKGAERGCGLASMRSVTERHHGYLELSHTETVFTLKAVLVVE